MRPTPAGSDFDGWVRQLAVPSRRQRARRHLLATGPRAVPAIRKGLQHPEPMVRRIPAQFNPRAPLQVTPPLQVLAMVASPRGLASLDVELERANLEEALQDLTAAGSLSGQGCFLVTTVTLEIPECFIPGSPVDTPAPRRTSVSSATATTLMIMA